jgi:hypothetical protein
MMEMRIQKTNRKKRRGTSQKCNMVKAKYTGEREREGGSRSSERDELF